MGANKQKFGKKRLHTSHRKKWKKGHSSDSNPSANQHRIAARSGFNKLHTTATHGHGHASGTSNLTVEALSKHDAATIGGTSMAVDDNSDHDAKTMSGFSFNTWATNWTECTNATFGRVHRHLHSNSALHKEILAVLAAVTEVIKENNGKETETEYFAALMTTLQNVDEPMSLAAVLYLLSLAIKRVPPAVLQRKFSDVAKILMNCLEKNISSDTTSLVRSVVVCLAALLRVQDLSTWESASTKRIFDSLLALSVSPKPKVRKASQNAVRAILKGSTLLSKPNAPRHHPAATNTAEFCIEHIRKHAGTESTILHTLALMRDVISTFKSGSLKSTCETLLSLITLNSMMVTASAMSVFNAMFISEPAGLSAEVNEQIITALYRFQPSENDIQPMNAWLTVMESAHINLARRNQDLCMRHLPRLTKTCMKCLLSERNEVVVCSAKCIQMLLEKCVSLCITEETFTPSTKERVHEVFSQIEAGLSYQYHTSWGHVMEVLTVAYKVLGSRCSQMLSKSLLSMANLRNNPNFPYTGELDKAFGVAVKYMGPRTVVDAVPLEIHPEKDDIDFPRSWLLPILRDNVQNTELAYFATTLLPLAARLRERAELYVKAGRGVEYKLYMTLHTQIWSMLPAFCNGATDIVKSFRSLAKIIGTAIQEKDDIRIELLTSLRTLITQNIDKPAERQALAMFDKNFLPLLFNLYSLENKLTTNHKQAVLSTIASYLQIADRKNVAVYYKNCFKKFEDPNVKLDSKIDLMDIVMTLVPYGEHKQLESVFSYAVEHMGSANHTVQKKSYRILEQLCSAETKNCKSFVAAHMDLIIEKLVSVLHKATPSAKRPRLKCLIHIVEQLEEIPEQFIQKLIPEAVLCTREDGVTVRAAAFKLLTAICETYIRLSDADKQEVIEAYAEMLLPGLGGEANMVSATISAINAIVYEYRGDVSHGLLSKLFEMNCLLLRSAARQIAEAALGLVKVLMTSFDQATLLQYLPDLVESLVAMKVESKHHFRFKTKQIFTRLMRKFGYETVMKLTPESMHKMLANINKTERRLKKRKATAANESDESDDEGIEMRKPTEDMDELLRDTDSEIEEGELDKTAKNKRKIKKAVRPSQRAAAQKGSYLQEGEDDEIIDFMDSSAAKQVLATKPSQARKRSLSESLRGFKPAPDGRLIIKEDVDEREQHTKKRKHQGAGSDDDDDIDDLLDALSGYKRSKKHRSTVDDYNDDDSASRYQAGGHGIHRPLGNKKSSGKSGSSKSVSGEAFKAKKAGGDIKKKGMPDPYAYVPLQMSNLNRRKQAKLKGQFKGFVKGAKRGAQKGQKMHRRK